MTTRRPPADGPGSPGLPWHVSHALARRYADGSAAETDAWSLEKHVESCAGCAGRVSAAVRAGAAGPVLASVRDELLASLGPGRAREGARAVRPGSPDGRTASDASPGGRTASDASPDGRTAADASPGHRTAAPASLGRRIAAAASLRRRPESATSAWQRPESATSPGRRPESATSPGRRPDAATSPRPDAAASAGIRPSRLAPAPTPHAPTPFGRWARLWWAVGPALRGSWVVAVLLVVGGAFGLAHGAGVQGARSLLLALSPVLPLAGVAVSYGRHADPLYEITAATPSGGLRLLLTRTAAVLAVCVPLLTAGGALLPPVAGFPGAAAWLLPGLALTLATLALGSFVGCRAAAATLGGGWLLAVAGPLLGPADTAASATALAPYFSGPAVQGGWAATALACAALLALRRRSFDHLESP
ncbi:zf-HC2 domain-containing protein [Streptomyces sp. TX20-6-3]|uniref:zf-HC2 domain-containing protein n=1 Tax=Streptomyces sp. TX20-6-3 TaxID=3028705 RepID=UPI0029B24CAD|nr:zf-HC2 domain-containing protein [Streptomyces sp. TX20-6-3]MDX2559380.1 zf-HC2 domain-containing protein [Streptomyces sp. TX20-6-3]